MKKMTLKKLDLGLSLLAIIHKNIFESAFFFFFFLQVDQRCDNRGNCSKMSGYKSGTETGKS